MKKTIKLIKKNSVLSLFVGLFAMLLLIMIIFLVVKRGTFGVAAENNIVIDCPSVFSPGEVISCDVSYESNDSRLIYSVNANYNLGSGIEYRSFTVENTECTGEDSCTELFESSEEGFVVINLDGFDEDTFLGTLEVKMPDNVTPMSEHSIGLNVIELCYDDNGEPAEEMLELGDVSVTTRAANNVATLKSLSLSAGSLNHQFASNTFEYSTTVGSDVTEIGIEYSLTDSNATASGSGILGNASLHYGTNTFEIVVTAEDGVTKNTYTISIYREYEFGTEVYTYNKQENWIYTAGDIGNTIISNLERPEDNITYQLNADLDKLKVIYGADEVLLTIDIVNFSMNYEIINKQIHIQDNLTFSNFLSNVANPKNLVFELRDGNNQKITDNSAVIGNDYKLNIYYGADEPIDSYSFVCEYLNIDQTLVVDSNKMIIKRLNYGTTYNQLKEKIDTSGTIKFFNRNNQQYDQSSYSDVIKTEDVVEIDFGETKVRYALSVLGDVIGDGVLNVQDVGRLYRYSQGKATLSEAGILAGDVIINGTINVQDVGRLYRYIYNKVSKLEVVIND